MISKEKVDKLNTKMLEFFSQFSNVYPRGSKKEVKAAEFLVKFAKDRNLEVFHQSEIINNIPVNNVVIKKPGTAGYENAKPVVLQAHIDMVCVKNPDSKHDFDNEPIHIKDDGKTYTTQDGTTLGADDGIGVACAMAFLDCDYISHPPLEAVFTSDEEDGMSGAGNYDKSKLILNGRTFINIDAEDEGLFYYGCAGGIYAKSKFSFNYVNLPQGNGVYTISISGLMGGHSGIQIDKKRANANRLMGRLLHELTYEFPENAFYLSGIDGGSFPNAIASTCTATISTVLPDEVVVHKVNEIAEIFKQEYLEIEKDMLIKLSTRKEYALKALPFETFKGIVSTLMLVPNDVIAMSNTVDGLVETSANLGLVKKDPKENAYIITSFIRSSVDTRKAFVVEQMRRMADYFGAEFFTDKDNPGWSPNVNSEILKVFKETYVETFQTEAIATAVHAGLECGYFAKKYPDMDLISVGPTITGAHSPEETLKLDTTPKVVELLANVFEKLK